ncbi:hypothetical protein ABIF38_001739 [Bradyrhizobium japonicum]|jgi:hypothetical protein|uniref:DUF6894 family protein n=1 Tax=Bradyrhizobium TaxID=374 RepID=UPI0004776281|nr:hypothetical protein [Bradyrhizobium elkanii]MCP1735945.1 hypothetical protein [Bradyrhizobium elkanii]MCS3571286.1 hypothetical protein [Bradyrhizobium elkanii]MCS3587231.1 hypothetical protein [Bradyrhizobium elkanii]MCS3625465.1 hypothetical protein [Bradyrhizobium elkanii]MCS3687481.1 hypothetical protein [Bradyrhizobium elkanii]
MPRYYFDLKDGSGTAVDEEGIDLRDVDAAQSEAAQSLGAMARDAAITTKGRGTDQMEIEVRDEDGPVMTVRFYFEISRKKVS